MRHHIKRMTPRGMAAWFLVVLGFLTVFFAGPAYAQQPCPPPMWTCSEGCDLQWDGVYCSGVYCAYFPFIKCSENTYIVLQWNPASGTCNLICGFMYDFNCSCYEA